MFHFTKFVEWPEASLPAADSPFIIGVMGSNPFGVELERAVKDRKINGHPILIKAVGNVEEARAVHMLFLCASEKARTGRILDGLGSAAVLTVGDTEEFGRAGGGINFLLEGDKVRFEINMEAAGNGGIKISAQLQKLAKTVRKSK